VSLVVVVKTQQKMLSLLLTIVVNISMICCKDILAEEIINVEIVVDYC
jgi:hypothetical protein